MAAVTVLFTVLLSVILTFAQTGCLELSFSFCTFLSYVRDLFRFLFNKLDDDDDDDLGTAFIIAVGTNQVLKIAGLLFDRKNFQPSWVENCRNARGCFFVHFKAKRGVSAVSFIDLRKFMI